MTLEVVPFRKGRVHLPRLSPVPVQGRHDERFWAKAELDVVRAHYAARGATFCASLLPGRSESAIYQVAYKLNLKRPGRSAHTSRKTAYAAIDEAIRKEWHKLHGRGAVKAFAARIDQPRWLVSKRAAALGFTVPHRKEPVWSPAELALLKKVPLHDPALASRTFRTHGFYRSATAIVVKCKRLGLSRRYREALSGHGAAQLLGVDSKTVSAWILDGHLKGGRRGTRRLPQQGGDYHTIARSELRRFVIEHLERIDIRKVDKFAFVDLLTRSDEA